MAKVATAWVEVHPDTTKFAERLKTQLKDTDALTSRGSPGRTP